jgi:uncharacterized membrane protein
MTPLPRRALLAAFVVYVFASSAQEGIWYLGIAESLYDRHIGALMREPFDVPVAVLFYLFYALGALLFALAPALRSGRLAQAAGLSAAYGFFCFASHDLTNLADIRGYTPTIAAVDIAWGTLMSAVAGALAFMGARRLR